MQLTQHSLNYLIRRPFGDIAGGIPAKGFRRSVAYAGDRCYFTSMPERTQVPTERLPPV